MEEAIVQEVRERARSLCEYCRLPEADSRLSFVLDHIIARQHGGASILANLALACGRCNRHKGPNIAGIDPFTQVMTRLFNPRTDAWSAHFEWRGAVLTGLSAVGRATIGVLAVNHPYQVATRQALIDEGRFPTDQANGPNAR